MEVMVISIVIGAFGTILWGSVKWLEELEIGGADTIQTSEVLRSAKILKRVLETCGDFL